MAMTLITTNTSSNAASSDFTSSIDNTYKLYIFKFFDVNPATDNVSFMFDCSISETFGTTKTTTYFVAYHNEADGDTSLSYQAARDLAQGTGNQTLTVTTGNGADESAAGELYLFNPSNTTYVKHFYSRANSYEGNNYTMDNYSSGYINATGAVDGVKFLMSSGNMDAVIKMYGVG